MYLHLIRKLNILICSILFAFSCKTYKRTVVLDRWIDKWNVQHTVYQNKYYCRKNDSLYKISLDTAHFDLSERDADSYRNNPFFKGVNR